MEAPLQSALLAGRQLQEEEGKVISDDQIRQLLVFMGTITIVSFVLVIALITVFVAFIWYSRTRLRGRCSCSLHPDAKLKHHQDLHQLEGGGRHHHHHNQLPAGVHGQPVKMFAVVPGQFQLRRSAGAGHKNVIVNPLPCPGGGRTVRNLGSAVKPTGRGTAGQVQDELDQIATKAEEEPIYAEIKPRAEEAEAEKVSKIPPVEAGEVGEEDVAEEEDEGSSGKKKEIEYWQITAKEVVKFRPCTETFIQRE